jgi:hypothetical protein
MPYDPKKPPSPENPPPGGYNPPGGVDLVLSLPERSRSVLGRIAPHVEELVKIMLKHARGRNKKESRAAAQWLLERYGGKPIQSVTGEDGKPLIPDGGGLLDVLKRIADKHE